MTQICENMASEPWVMFTIRFGLGSGSELAKWFRSGRCCLSGHKAGRVGRRVDAVPAGRFGTAGRFGPTVG